MNRRLPLVSSVIAIAALSAGCTTFSDNANVARVGDATLTEDDFQTQLTDLGAPSDQVLPAETVRAQITSWIQEQIVASDIPALDATEAAAFYDAGIRTGGTLCISGIVVETRDTASRVADELADGADFLELLEAENLDPSLGQVGGDVGCITSSTVDEAADVEFVQVAARLNAENTVDISPILDTEGNEFAWVVLSFRTFAELAEADVAAVLAELTNTRRLASADVFVDPRYGTFDAATGQVVALG